MHSHFCLYINAYIKQTKNLQDLSAQERSMCIILYFGIVHSRLMIRWEYFTNPYAITTITMKILRDSLQEQF